MADRMSIEDRFWSKVEKQFCGCWLWHGTMFSTGYGSFKANGQIKVAHRLSYQFLKGEIPEGLQLDHLCRVRKCVNPEHLEPVTRKENLLRGASFSGENSRKTSCPQGHALEGENLVKSTLRAGKRACRICANNNQRLRRKLKRGACH